MTERINTIVSVVFRLLPSTDFMFDTSRARKGGPLFEIVHRAPTGQRHANGRKYHNIGGPTLWQMQNVCQTSPDDTEAAQRIIDHFVHGKDTISAPQPKAAPTLDAIEKLVAERVAQALAGLNLPSVDKESIAHQATKETAMRVAREADVPVTNADNAVRAKGPQKAPRQFVNADRRAKEDALWNDRAAILGIEVVRRPRDNAIDGRWIRTATRLWQEHLANAPQTTELATTE